MKLFLKIFSVIYFFQIFGFHTLAISNYEIIRICRKQRNEKECKKKLKLNRDLLNKGKPIEIPVYNYKRK